MIKAGANSKFCKNHQTHCKANYPCKEAKKRIYNLPHAENPYNNAMDTSTQQE
jgi:hypothetical protein